MIIQPTPENLINPRKFAVLDARAQLHGSVLRFTQTFHKLLTKRDFNIAPTVGREPPQITVFKQFTRMFNLEIKRLVINMPPGHGKSTMTSYFIAWAMSQYPDCNFIYASYAKKVAAKNTALIKNIMLLKEYRDIFEIDIKRDSSAKDDFSTIQGGRIMACGTEGSITGMDAGLQVMGRYSGTLFIDDAHNSREIHSDTIREGVIQTYNEVLKDRARSPDVSLCYIGHRGREDDLPDFLLKGEDGHYWDRIVLQDLDETNNTALNPNVRTAEALLKEKEFNPYAFWSKHQQNPQPAGGGIFQKSWMPLLEEEPEIIATFVSVDCAETEKEWNDATALLFLGIYRIIQNGVDTGELGLHVLHCIEKRVEPKALEPLFWEFYATCRSYKVKPDTAIIEAKSTGTTLCSLLEDVPGLRLIKIKRTVGEEADKDAKRVSSKITRFLSMQRFIASKRLSLPAYARHTKGFVEHMCKITANNTHAHDDTCDAVYDGYKAAIIDGIIWSEDKTNTEIVSNLSNNAILHQKIAKSRWK